MSSVDCGNEKLAKDSGSRPAVSWYMDGMVSEWLGEDRESRGLKSRRLERDLHFYELHPLRCLT